MLKGGLNPECAGLGGRQADDHLPVAIGAFPRFGKGRHPAALNFGDCLSYAMANVGGMELMYVGEDFGRTDLGVGR